jgi:hypothetical protein
MKKTSKVILIIFNTILLIFLIINKQLATYLFGEVQKNIPSALEPACVPSPKALAAGDRQAGFYRLLFRLT